MTGLCTISGESHNQKTLILHFDHWLSREGYLRTAEKVLRGEEMVPGLQEVAYSQKQVVDKLKIEPGLGPKVAFRKFRPGHMGQAFRQRPLRQLGLSRLGLGPTES